MERESQKIKVRFVETSQRSTVICVEWILDTLLSWKLADNSM